MESANTRLRDLQIRHAIHLLKFGNGLERDILKLLAAADADILERIAGRLALIEARGIDIGPATTARLDALLAEVRTVNDGVYSRLYDGLSEHLATLTAAEAAFQASALTAALAVNVRTNLPAPALLASIATERPMQGELLKPFVNGMAAGRMGRIEQAVRIGMVEGQGVEAIVRRIKGTKAANYTDGILEISRNSARSIVRTSINHVSNQAAQETWRANDHLVKGWQFVATLDSRTTIICASLDGQTFPVGKGPVPPRHIRCRSITTAVTKSFKELGLNRDEYDEGTRASVDGQVATPITFEKWLRDQSPERQEAILGKARADLWRSGKFKLSDFVKDNREVISLDELRKLNPAAAAPVAPTPKPKAEPAKTGPLKPVNPDVTAETVRVRPRKDVNKSLSERLKTNAADHRYDSRHEFRSIKDSDFGKSALSAGFTDEAASMVDAIVPEIDAITDAFGVPRLRAIKTGNGKSIATMGDGTLTLNPTYFNGYASEIGSGTGIATVRAAIVAERDALAIELKALSDELGQMRIQLRDLTGAEKEAFAHRYLDKADVFNAKREQWLKLDKKVLKARTSEGAASKPVSNWKPGDDVASRPYNAVYYFERPMDRARNVIFHEVGHHIHQMVGKAGRRNQVGNPPLEKQLRAMFQGKFFKLGEGYEKKKLVSTTYATTNEHEWFAESFGLYMMGRYDLVDPDLLALIERILSEVSQR